MLSGARRVAMMLLLMMLTTASAWAETVTTNYVDADGTLHDNITATVLTGNETEIGGGWYVVDHDITYTSPLIITGDVTLILANGKTMSVGTSENPIIGNKECVFGTESNSGSPHSLTIYGQSLDDDQAGHLEVYASADNTHSPYGIKASDYIQHSGNVTSNAVFSAIEAYSVTLNGGTINATSTSSDNPEISTGNRSAIYCSNSSFNVAGGTFTANSASSNGVQASGINVTGGIINSVGDRGLASDMTINITGGKVTARGQSGGISGNNGINLGYSSPDDYIIATAYDCMTGTVNILANTKFKVGETATALDGGNSGRELTAEEISSIANQELKPAFAVTFNTGVEGISVATQYLLYNETATEPTAPTREGYVFDKWMLGANEYSFDTPVTSDVALTATWIQVGDLKITNTVGSDLAADADVEFSFTVTLDDTTISGIYGDMAFADGEATVTLKGGENKTATNIPYSTTYTVTQTAVDGFTTTQTEAQGTISAPETTAAFTNTRQTGDLEISAVLVSDRVADADVDFTFTVTLGDNTISKTYGDLEGNPIGMTFENGVATVTLKGDKSAKATGLPTSVTYTVAQSEATGFVTSKTGETGTISTTASTAVFTNTRQTGDLSVTNAVYGDDDQSFVYTVTLEGTTTNGNHGHMTFENGVATVTLKGGEYAVAAGVPTGVSYTVTQTNNDEFTTTQTGNTGTISATNAAYAEFKNIKLMPASVSIDWNDGDDENGRPGELTVNLLSKLKDDESDPLPVTGQNKTLNAENNWTVTIYQLPKFNEDGDEIEYSWSTITAPEGYLLTASDPGADASYTFTKATTATLAVTWNDNNNQDGIRPTALTVTLNNGDGVYGTYEINSEGDWTTTVNNLPMYNTSNNLIEYTWTITTNLPEGYTLPDTPITTELTLSYTPETTSSTVRVNWGDDDNRDNIRPTALTVTLLAKVGDNAAVALDPQPTISWTKNENDWTATVTGLPKNENGTEIAYTWTVTTANLPEGYTLAFTETSEGITSLDLMHNTSKTEATLQITWYDANNGSSRLPVGAALYVGENPVEGKTVTLDSDNEWTATISDLPANDNGVAIVYTWKVEEGPETELTNAGYTLYDTSTSGTVTTLIYRKAVAQPEDFKFAESNVTKTIDNGSFTIEPIGAQENPTITYSSSNVSVAEVDETTGEVTIKGSGVTTITATAAETNNYLSATAKYTLTVTGGSTVSIQLTENYGTFCWNQDLDFSGITGLDAYIAAGYNASTGVLTMVKVTSVPAGTGLLLRGSAGYNYTATVQSSTWVYANLLRGTTTETSLTAGGNDFILGKKNGTIGFYPVSENGKIAANKAYLHLDNIPNTSSARSFVSISFVDDATALDAVRWNKETGRGDAWYSLDGRKLQGKPTVKGLYIHNGKKEAVK